MAITTRAVPNPVAGYESSGSINASLQTLSTGAGTLYLIQGDNLLGSAENYLKFWDAAAPIVGTTAPNVQIALPAGFKVEYLILQGLTFSTAIKAACVTEPGTAGSTNPAATVNSAAQHS